MQGSQTPPKGILVDLDDTILVFEPLSAPSWKQVIAEEQSRIVPVEPERFYHHILDAATLYWSDAKRHQTGRLNPDGARASFVLEAMKRVGLPLDEEWALTVARRFGQVRTEAIYPVPGALETLRQLNQYGIPLILVTNGDAQGQRKKIERFHLEPFFQTILIEEECGFGKPDVRIYAKALQELDADPHEVWMVGDNLEWEVLVPQLIGIRGVWVDYRGSGVPSQHAAWPYRIIRTFSDILPLLAREFPGIMADRANAPNAE